MSPTSGTTTSVQVAGSPITLTSAALVAPEALAAFYARMYPARGEWLARNWRWHYQVTGALDPAPLLLVHKDRVIGHAGRIPISVALDRHRYSAAWFVDFALLPEVRRMGLGTILTQAWMELSDVHFAFCNEQSMGVFRKLGWGESCETRHHYMLIRPFEHPKLASHLPRAIRAGLTRAVDAIFRRVYSRGRCGAHILNMIPLSGRSLEALREAPPSSGVLRNMEFMDWRLRQSPDFAKYFECRVDEALAIVKTVERGPKRYVDVLWMSGRDAPSLQRLLRSLAIWALDRGFSLVRFLTPDRAWSERLANSLHTVVRRIRFAYSARNRELQQRLAGVTWGWQGWDSDVEEFQ